MECFNGISMEVPACPEAHDNPHYHSIVGTKLLYVDWERTHGVRVPCPDGTCGGMLGYYDRLKNKTRSNYSKNKTLFPIFNLDGQPTWCIVMKLQCDCCSRDFDANEGDVLVNLPDHIANEYPVETNYALANCASHLSRNTTDVFASLLLTYGNGEMCSRLLYNGLNKSYIRRLKCCYSKAKENQNQNGKKVLEYIDKDGVYIKTYPPLGDTVRDMFDAAASNNNNPWRISDYERHTREIQSVTCTGIFCQDHTFELVKNYRKRSLGASAAWTCGTQTGEVACVALVPSTKTEDFAHCASQLTRRPNFKQEYMHSDAWPNKEGFWARFGVQGRLGLFHFEQRVIRTLRKNHVDYSRAVTDFLSALYHYYAPDYEKLLTALKDGKFSKKKYSSEEIADLKAGKLFRERHAKYLRKVIHEPTTIQQNLDDWFCKYKVTSTDPINKPAGGRLDPIRQVPLFTVDTKTAVENCKDKAKYLSDPFPLEDMYDKILPNPNSTHQLTEYLSKRGESKLEAFHD